jgi:hypothetical protein
LGVVEGDAAAFALVESCVVVDHEVFGGVVGDFPEAELDAGEDEAGVEEGFGFVGFGGGEEEAVGGDVENFGAFGLFDGSFGSFDASAVCRSNFAPEI